MLRIGQALQSHGRLQEGLDVLLTRKDDFADQPRFLACFAIRRGLEGYHACNGVGNGRD